MTSCSSTIRRCTSAVLVLLISRDAVPAALLSDKPVSQYTITRWTPGTTFPAATVRALAQSHDGYLWIGATEGLWRYDGVRFASYDRSVYPALLSNRVQSLMEDMHGNLWIGTEGGGLSRLSHGRITTFTSRQGLPSDYVRALAEDSDGGIWVGTDGEGICRISPDTIVTYGRENSNIDGRVTSLAVDRMNALWVGTYDGLFRLFGNAWTRFDRSNGLSSDSILCLLETAGELWIGTYGGGISVLKDGIFSTISESDGLPGKIVTRISGDTATGIWVSLLRGGVSRISHGKVSSCPMEGRDRGAYPISILRDREGSVWVGFQNEGLVRLRDAALTWFRSDENSKPNPVRSVTEDRAGVIWTGTANGVRRLNQNGELLPLPSPHQPTDIMSLAEDADGSMWIGTLGHGLYRERGGTFKKISVGSIATIWALYTDRTGTVWAGSNAGLVRISHAAPTVYTHNRSGLSHDDVRAICEGKDGTLWVGTSYGLDKMEHGTFSVLTKNTSAISNDVVVALHADVNGDVWVGTLGGLNRLRDGKFKTFTTVDGLPDDVAGMILEDTRGYFWISCDKGLYRIEKRNLNDYADGETYALHPVILGQADGLLDPGVSGTIQPSAWKSHDGRVWFATNGGLAMADPGHLDVDVTPPNTVIEGMTIDGNPVRIDSIAPLSHIVDQFEIAYTAPTFVKPEEVNFRYVLEGFTHDWINAGPRRTAYFTHVPPGRYRFRVLASGPTGIWGDHGSILDVEVLPPFWMTWWFRSAVMACMVVALFLGYRQHLSKLRKEKELQLHLTRQLLEGQEAERKRIAAELHDGLGQNLMIIRNLALLGGQSSGDPEQRMNHLREIAETAGSTLDDVRRIAHNLRPVNLERFGLTESLRFMLDSMTGSSSIDLRSEIDDLTGLLDGEAEIHFFRIVQEAMNNILKHSGSRTASVEVRRLGEGFRCSVEDTGKGFEAETQRAGLGLSDITERVKLLGGSLSVKSRPGEGTRIEITIPERQRP